MGGVPSGLSRLQAGLSVEVAAQTDAQLDADTIRQLVSVVREALSNTARHAAASRAQVLLRETDGQLELEVSDDGRGFDVDARRDVGHRGLANMRRRVERLGGTLDVWSRPGAGTRIIVMLPTEGRQAHTEELAGHERAHEA